MLTVLKDFERSLPAPVPIFVAAVPGSAPLLPASRAFLVQISGDCDPGSERVAGRVEHVRSGEAAHFVSDDELLSFMRHVLTQKASADREPQAGITPETGSRNSGNRRRRS